jgi:MFS family permease
MLASITPLGERGRHNRFAVTAAAYGAGCVAGGIVAGAAAAAVGSAVRFLWEPPAGLIGAAVAVIAAVALAFDLHLRDLRLPTVRRQVDERWLDTYRGWVYGSGFGFQLGLGVVTIVTTAAIYAASALAVVSAAAGSAAGAVAIGVTFGTVRGASILLAVPVHDPARLRTLHRSLSRRAPAARTVTLVTHGAVVTAAFLVLGTVAR